MKTGFSGKQMDLAICWGVYPKGTLPDSFSRDLNWKAICLSQHYSLINNRLAVWNYLEAFG
jgi:hypothetical protein